MAIFAVTFRIHEDSTYRERYNSVVAAIQGCALGGRHWAEPTSFFLLESNLDATQLAAAIDKNSSFVSSKDLLAVFSQTHKAYKVIGHYTDPDIDNLMRKA